MRVQRLCGRLPTAADQPAQVDPEDLLTHEAFPASRRGALIKPWLFWEFREGRELNPTAAERVAIYRRLIACAYLVLF